VNVKSFFQLHILESLVNLDLRSGVLGVWGGERRWRWWRRKRRAKNFEACSGYKLFSFSIR
jgi:hypothetical protein